MFQIILSLTVGILIGWNFHIFFMALEPKNIPKYTNIISPKVDIKKCEPTTIVINSIKEKSLLKKVTTKEHNISTNSIKISEELPFERLINSGNFSDAMAFYMEANNTQLKDYRLMVKVYFYDMGTKFPKKTIEQILYYIDIEPKSTDIKLYLAKLYRDSGEFEKAIKVLFDLQSSEDIENLKSVESDLNTTVEKYIKNLKTTKNFKQLILFLEDMINKKIDNQKYIIRLAKLYYELDDYEKAEKLLEDIESDSTYSAKAKTMLTNIEQKREEIKQYTHKIALTKIGSQYSINIIIDDIPLVLLLDTGASYTFIDEDKISSISMEKEILLNTAGGEIIAHLATAKSLILDDIELKDFKLTVAPFKQKGVDGLLGMNFFEKFNFKIDQNRTLLYLKLK